MTLSDNEIKQIIDEFLNMTTERQYIGARYVPIFGRKDEDSILWDNTAPYEPLTIVLHQGNSYTSRQFVPIGVDISNEEFWANTGNYNAQIEQYRQETQRVQEELEMLEFYSIKPFDTVDDMVNDDDLQVGMICHTNGFHAAGDGGAAFYKITATGTANGMDVLECDDLYANLVITESYVTPEMFGAYGDGVHDDVDAINRMFVIGDSMFSFSPKTYKISNYITLGVSGITVRGNGCTIASGNKSGFVIPETTHDVEITGINFVQSFTVGSTDTPNYGINVSGPSTTALYQAYNIRILECSFTGGVFGIVATSAQNLEIGQCNFGTFIYKPSDGAGGYGILTQSCHNVFIHDCSFNDGDYNRHNVYISVSQLKTENINNSNVTIERCRFDHSAMNKQSSGAYYSSSTVAVAVRAVENFTLANCVAVEATGLVAFNSTDGATVNCNVIGCKLVRPVFIGSGIAPSEQRYGISSFSTENDATSSLFISEFVVDSPDSASYNDASVAGGTIEYCNSKPVNRFYIGNVIEATIHNIYVDHHGAITYTGTQTLNGHMYAINGGDYYAFVATGTGKTSSSFFESNLMHYTIGNTGTVGGETGKPHIRITATVDDGTITMTFTDMAEPPFAMSFESIGATPIVASVTRTDAALSANQLYIKLYSLAGAQISTGMYSRIFFN